MKYISIKILSSLFTALCLVALLSSCFDKAVDKTTETAKQAIATLDKAINSLQSESINWRQVLEETRDGLVDETQSTIKNEVNNLISNGIAATGGEIRCNADFIRNRMRQELIHLRNEVAQKVGVSLLPESTLEPGVCQVTPASIDLALEPERRNELKLAGYDFDRTNITVILLNKDKEIDVTAKLAQPSKYLLTLNLSPTNGIQFSEKSNQILVKATKSGNLISLINILQPPDNVLKHTEVIDLRTGIDDNNMTKCPQNFMVVGMSGGRGHSSEFNEPHNIRCAKLSIPSTRASAKVSDGSVLETLIDSRTMTPCPPNSVVTALTGGFGHSSVHNTPHSFLCQRVEQGFKVGRSYNTNTLIDNDAMTVCKNGDAITGITGGYGHSSKFNEGHTIQCSEIIKE